MKSKWLVFYIVILVGCIGSVSSDVYTPSIPFISKALGVSISSVQLTMSIFMLGMAIAQLFYGPLSEGIGRKLPLISGLVVVLIGSAICYYAPNIEVLMLGRFIQGCGAGAGTLFRPIFRDVFKGDELAQFGSYAGIIIVFVVSAAPALGGYFQQYIGWRANFAFIFLYAIVSVMAVVFLLKETGRHHHKDRLKPSFIGKTYLEVLSSKVFMGFTLCTFVGYGAFFAWFVSGPVLLIHVANLSPVTFGWITLIGGGAAMLLTGVINSRLVKRVGSETMLKFGWSVMLLAGVLLLLGYFIFGVNPIAIVIPVILFYFGVTFIWPNIYGLAFTPFGHIAGYAGAIYGFVQIAGGAVLAALMAHLPHANQISLAAVFIIAPVVSFVCLKLIKVL